jgi:oxalate---CoA ligase
MELNEGKGMESEIGKTKAAGEATAPEVSTALTIQEVLGKQAAGNSAGICIISEVQEPLRFGALQESVEAIARRFRMLGVTREDRVALVLPNGPDLAVAFLAVTSCATAVPLNPAFKKEEFERYFESLKVSVVVLDEGGDSPAAGVAGKRDLPVLELVHNRAGSSTCFDLRGETGRAPSEGAPARAEDIALLLHTSGTTGRHKVVPLTHENVCRAAASICSSVALSKSDRCLNVMPLHYIHGFSALLATIMAGGSIVCTPGYSDSRFYEWMNMFSPTWYTASPTIHQAVLEGAAAHGDAIAGHTLRFIRSASSAMPEQLIRDMEKEFRVPFVEAYGMTETSPQVASNGLAQGERKLGSVGKAAGPEVGIMDENGSLLPAGQSGEIVVRGPNVMQEYENDPEANAMAFSNGWFRTGDLGNLDEEGFLFITGRKKEMINRGGEKVSPREIDMILLEHPAVAEAAAFALPHPRLGEEVAAAVRLRAGATASEEEIREFVATRVAEFKVPRRILIVTEIPKSSAGKVRRSDLGEKLGIRPHATEPALATGPADAPRDQLEWQLLKIWERILHIRTVGVRDNFFELGGHSLLAVTLFEEVEKLTGRSYPLALLLRAPTIEGLAVALRQEGWRSPQSSLVPIQPAGSNPPLYCAHGGGGNVLSFEALARHLGKDQPLYGLQSYGLDGGTPFTRVEDMANQYLRDILTFQQEGPYFLEGMSFGGLVALEMAHELTHRGKQVALLALLDTYPKGVQKTLRRESLGRKIELRLSEFLALERHDKQLFLRNRTDEMLGGLRTRFRRASPSAIRKEESNTARIVRTVREANLIASLKYEPQPYRGPVTIFWARESFVNSTHRFRAGWSILASNHLEMIVVPGTHITMFEEPNVQVLAREMNLCIQRARITTPNGA